MSSRREPGVEAGSVPARRLAAQQLVRPVLADPAALVGWFGAIQAQDPAAARWAVGLRLRGGAAEADVERSLARGDLLRTHALRGTWHLVARVDLRWILSLVAPRVLARLARRHRELGLDAGVLRVGRAAIARALRDGRPLTRDELGGVLRGSGVSPEGPRLSHLLAVAELEALICSGPPRGRQATFTLFDARVPPSRAPFDRDAALAELARRYLQSHGPATPADFAWWSGLPPADARPAFEAAARGAGPRPRASRSTAVHLLPPFDEYLVAYRDRDGVLDPREARRVNSGGGMLDPVVVANGVVVGTWRRELGRGRVLVQVERFGAAAGAPRAAVEEAARRYGAFLGLEVELEVRRREG